MMRKHSRPGAKHLPRGLAIVYEDRDLLVVDKPAGLLTIATDKEKTRTAYFLLTDYVRKGQRKSRNRIFIVHRLDRETSGVLVFAKTSEAKVALQSQWKTTRKMYLAVVRGLCARQSDTITSYLAENAAHFVYSTSDPRQGKVAHTAYRVLKEARGLSLLEVELLTGRKHQIRVHLAGIGHPILGDQRYGDEDREHERLALHARSISFKHPFSGKEVAFDTGVPVYFTRLVGNLERSGGKLADARRAERE